jgi:YhcH/YjgK/YiaL family protein
MIIDDLKNSSIYIKLHSRFEDAFNYLKENDFSTIEPGDYEIDGNNIYAMVRNMDTKLKESCSWQSHKKYIDIHYLFEGVEGFGYASVDQMKFSVYDEKKDKVTLTGNGDFFTLYKGSFIVCYPQDIHMPAVALKEPEKITKIIIKVKI